MEDVKAVLVIIEHAIAAVLENLLFPQKHRALTINSIHMLRRRIGATPSAWAGFQIASSELPPSPCCERRWLAKQFGLAAGVP